jgi:hypothetical protein
MMSYLRVRSENLDAWQFSEGLDVDVAPPVLERPPAMFVSH